MENMTAEELEDYIIINGIATAEEIKLIEQINGVRIDSLEAVLYARTGLHIEQLKD